MAWHAPERFRAFRLLRIQPADAFFSEELTLFLQACKVLDPAPGSLISELWIDEVSPLALPALEEAFGRANSQLAVPDQATARGRLQTIIDREIERLEEKAAWHEERAELKSALSPRTCSHLSDTREGELMRRLRKRLRKAAQAQPR